MHIKVRGGTVASGESSLCAMCRYATVIKGRSLREEIVECSQLADGHGRITFSVTHCTKYVHRNHPSLYEMESIAWVLRTDASRRHIGFVPSRDLEPGERFVLPGDED
jgi:hypothetical protein